MALLYKNRGRSKYASDSSDSLKILKDRLARGEITLAEYDTLKNVL
ncbi:MAG: SHOCT domain-containing protein [Desulfovibrio sp.]|nr:SHOCT domain-containing protein [Desulfovibrio sp.]